MKTNNSKFYLKLIVITMVLIILTPTVNASPLTQVTEWGTIDPTCTWEHSACVADPAFDPSFGGYRAGGSVSWDFTFDPSSFSSISSIQLEVIVVGFVNYYPGNIDPSMGQLGNYLAIDDIPFAPFLQMTDGRDTRLIDLTAHGLTPGYHKFTVVAYSDPNAKYEGWAGVDYSKLTVTGDTGGSAPVPEPSTMLLLGLGLMGLAGVRRFKK